MKQTGFVSMARIRSVMFGLVLALGAPSPSVAKDNASGTPIDAIDAACDASANLCVESCKAANYSASQREQCTSGCIATWDDCRGSIAQRGTAGPVVGKPPAKFEPVRRPKRKPPIADPNLKLQN